MKHFLEVVICVCVVCVCVCVQFLKAFPLIGKTEYDERGLKVRSGSVSIVEEEATEIRKKMESEWLPGNM